MKRHLILVGLPGAGKSTVGALVARLLEVPFVDLDAVIERESGLTIPELFATLGEPTFRVLEQEAMATLLGRAGSVIAAGGGWAAQPGNLRGVEGRAVSVYLETAPTIAAARVAGSSNRPLLANTDPHERMGELLRMRDAWYRQATVTVDAGWGVPADVAERVVAAARDGLYAVEEPDDEA